MQKMSLKAYARKHKLSLFNVVKLVKTNQVKSIVLEENAKEVTYILIEDQNDKNPQDNKGPLDTSDCHTVYSVLKDEIAILKKEIKALKERMNNN